MDGQTNIDTQTDEDKKWGKDGGVGFKIVCRYVYERMDG